MNDEETRTVLLKILNELQWQNAHLKQISNWTTYIGWFLLVAGVLVALGLYDATF